MTDQKGDWAYTDHAAGVPLADRPKLALKHVPVRYWTCSRFY